jgi:putative transposase
MKHETVRSYYLVSLQYNYNFLEELKRSPYNKKRVLRLMRLMGLRSCLPKPKLNTSIPNKSDKARPYLLRGLAINKVNQVWAVDITYIKLPTGLVYLFALIDWHSRYVVAWKLANTMEAHHALEVLTMALLLGIPVIMNSDQGSQFTGEAWIEACELHGIKVSHDGVGRCIDNIRIERLWWSIKYVHVHLYNHQTMRELDRGLNRVHSLLQYPATPSIHRKINGSVPSLWVCG